MPDALSAVAEPPLCIVMPVYNGRQFIVRSLPPLLASGFPVIVVDDGSDDDSASLAAELGARVLATGGRRGPAGARNLGVQACDAAIVLFVDADVVTDAATVDAFRAAFSDPQTVAVYGSYDDAPDAEGFLSRYMNLRHHHGHRDATDAACSFWAGLGAVRRSNFEKAGGFDARRYPRPAVEDVELAWRLRRTGGRIRRVPQLQGKHLKRWTLGSALRSDLLCRALPWAELMLERPDAYRDLNVGASERGRAALALVLLVSLAGAGVWGAAPPLAIALVSAWLHRDFVALMWRCGGGPFALGALAYHQLYYAYSVSAFVFAWGRRLALPPGIPAE